MPRLPRGALYRDHCRVSLHRMRSGHIPRYASKHVVQIVRSARAADSRSLSIRNYVQIPCHESESGFHKTRQRIGRVGNPIV